MAPVSCKSLRSQPRRDGWLTICAGLWAHFPSFRKEGVGIFHLLRSRRVPVRVGFVTGGDALILPTSPKVPHVFPREEKSHALLAGRRSSPRKSKPMRPSPA